MILTLTFHSAHNYGAVWQAFALQQYLRSLNQDVACLDYRPKYLKPRLFSRTIKNPVLNLMRNLMVFPARWKRYVRFERFIKMYIKIFDYSKFIGEESVKDIVIAGSDQIWNKEITGNKFDKTYFLVPFNKAKKYSYAASLGSTNLDGIDVCKEWLERFDGIGVRESVLAEKLERIGLENIHYNVDPVFLLDSEFYRKFTKHVIHRKYALFYTLETNNEVQGIVKEKRKEFLTVSIGTFRNIYHTDKHFGSASPEMFLSLIANAEVVITNSFHAIAFSTIFNRNIEYIPLKNGRGSRIENLFALLGTKENFCYDTGNRKTLLNRQIEKSKDYLNEILRTDA